MADKEKKSWLQRTGQKIVDWAMDGGSTEDNLKMSGGAGDDISQSAAPLDEKKEEPKKEESLLAKQFGKKKERTWNDVKQKNNNDPVKIAEDLNNDPEYKAGELTKKGMEEFGYTQGEDGKWTPKPKTETPVTETTTTETKTGANDTTTTATTETSTTLEDAQKGLEDLKKQNEDLKNQIEAFKKGDGAFNKHMQRGLEMGAVTLDKDGNYVLTNVNKKGWEDWATILSAGASVIGLAMGVPIIPINFRKITGKDEKDKAIREFQKQLTDISAGNLAKVKDVESSKEAGDYIKKNQDSIDAFTNYVDKTASYKAKSDIDTSSEKELIETRTKAQIEADEKQFERIMEQLKAEQDFSLKVEALREQYKEQFAALESALSTGSAKELIKYQNADMYKEMEEMGITPSKLATWKAAQDKVSPADKNWNRVKMGIDAVTGILDSAAGFVPGNKGK